MSILTNLLKFIKALLRFGPPTMETTTTTTDTTTTKGPNASKKALCIGINDYPGTRNDLRGCVNDARNWSEILKKIYGFTIQDILLDKKATKGAVIASLKKLVSGSKKGDSLVVTNSSHGTQVPDRNGDENDGKDEAWCMYDGNLTDDDLRKIFSNLPEGVKLTVISDSCHSGTVTRAFMGAMDSEEYIKARYMPPEDDIEAFSVNSLPIREAVFSPQEGMQEVLISGCKSNEYSYDARINGKPTGAFSHYAIQVLKSHPRLTYEEFYKELRKTLPSNQYPQTPQLEGSTQSKKAIMFE